MAKLKLRWRWDGCDLFTGSARLEGSGGMAVQMRSNRRWAWKAFAWHKGEEYEAIYVVASKETAQRQVEKWLLKKRSAK